MIDLHTTRAEGASFILDTGADAIYEDNVGLAQSRQDIKSDTAIAALFSAGPAIPLADSNSISLTVDVTGKVYERLTGLDNVAYGLTGAFRQKLGLGAEAAWVQLFGSIARQQYEIDIRDSWVYRLGVGLGKRFGERWNVRADYVYDRRLADHHLVDEPGLPGDVFDLSGHTISLRSDFLYNETISLFASYALRVGDVASTAQETEAILRAATAVTPDPAFGRNFYAYRIDATTHTLGVGVSVVLGRRSSLNVGYEHLIGDARGGFTYHDNVVRVGFLFSY